MPHSTSHSTFTSRRGASGSPASRPALPPISLVSPGRAGCRLALGLLIAAAGCSKATRHIDRKPVFPVRGKLLVDDQPARGAMVVLHPLGGGFDAVRPRAQVGPDGSFQLCTYDGDDGAPAGEYAVTLEWRLAVDKGNGAEPGPNVLHHAYANPATSNLKVRVAEGPNELPPIAIRR